MVVRTRGLFQVLPMLVIVAAPLATHVVLAQREWGLAADLLIAAQTALLLWLALTRLRRPYNQVVAAGLLAGSLALGILHLRGGLVLSTGVPHALVYAGLLILFGLSLRPGRVPLVTALSHQIHGPLPPTVDCYTRRVTWAWCLFFLLQLLVSACLIAFAPVAWWSAFVNILNAPLLAVMFLGEKLSRPLWVTNPPRERLADIMRMIRLVKAQMTKHDLGCPRPREL